MEANSDNELIPSITPDVMKCLVRSGFFEKLDDLLCPRDHSHQREGCRGTTSSPNLYFWHRSFERTDLDDIFGVRSEEHTSELQSRLHLVCRLLLEKKK